MTWIGAGVTLSPHTDNTVQHDDITDRGYQEAGACSHDSYSG